MRTKNALKTFLYGILMTSIIAILGLVKTKCLLQYLGEEYVGIYQLFYQLFTYLSLVDGGISASVAFHLYKPIHEKDTKKINAIYCGAKYYFRIIGIIVIALGINNAKKALKNEQAVTKLTNDMLKKNSETLKQGSIEIAEESE